LKEFRNPNIDQSKEARHEASLGVVNSRISMETSITKWKRIPTIVMGNGHSEHFRSGMAYKDKWGSLYGNYKNIQ